MTDAYVIDQLKVARKYAVEGRDPVWAVDRYAWARYCVGVADGEHKTRHGRLFSRASNRVAAILFAWLHRAAVELPRG